MKKLAVLAIFILSQSLSACSGDVKEQLGMRREGPDEFAVERKPKLEVPPSFKLRPPAPGEEPLNASTPREEARKALVGAGTGEEEGESEGESALLKNAGSDAAESDIRAVLKQEYNNESDPDVIDRLRSLSDDNFQKTIVDPEKEKERIAENKKENKPITEGETPSKSINNDKSVIEKIFN